MRAYVAEGQNRCRESRDTPAHQYLTKFPKIRLVTSRQIRSCIVSKNDSNPSCVNGCSSATCPPAGAAQAQTSASGANAANDVDGPHAGKPEEKVDSVSARRPRKLACKRRSTLGGQSWGGSLCGCRHPTCLRRYACENSMYNGVKASAWHDTTDIF